MYIYMCTCMLSHNPMDCSPPCFSVHGVLQARALECVGPPPRDLPDPGIKLMSLKSPELVGGFLNTSATWEALSQNITQVKATLNKDKRNSS